MYKRINKKSLGKLIVCGSLTLTTITGAGCSIYATESEYLSRYPIFGTQKVKDNLAYWGGDERYITQYNGDDYQTSDLVYHFTALNRPITVGIYKSFDENYKQQFKYVFDYLNDIFAVINPDYKFEISSKFIDLCDIRITPACLHEDDKSIVAMATKPYTEDLSLYNIESADIKVNVKYKFSDAELRMILMHEMMHVLLCSRDINEHESQTTSLYNYNDIYCICRDIEANDSVPKDWVSLMPVDLSTFISLYGDSSTIENRTAYRTLIDKTLNECRSYLGDQFWYKEGFTLPSPEEEVSSASNEIQYTNCNYSNSSYDFEEEAEI